MTKTIDHLNRYRKSHLTKSNSLIIKILNKLRMEGNFHNLTKGIYEKPIIINNKLNCERLNDILFDHCRW